MSRVLALVEGQTEQTFVREVLAPDLGRLGVFLSASLIGKPRHKGGVRPWASARADILTALKQDQHRYCTTMFDYYGLPTDWPGRRTALPRPYREAVSTIERAVHEEICGELGDSFDQSRFVPYIQTHEFEALLFAEPQILADVAQCPSLSDHFEEIVAECGEPEAIDDHPETAPSKRILGVAPSYQKVLHGTIAAKQIGLAKMKQACPHFGEWVGRLEALGSREAT
jgi:hypothetical protein